MTDEFGFDDLDLREEPVREEEARQGPLFSHTCFCLTTTGC